METRGPTSTQPKRKAPDQHTQYGGGQSLHRGEAFVAMRRNEGRKPGEAGPQAGGRARRLFFPPVGPMSLTGSVLTGGNRPGDNLRKPREVQPDTGRHRCNQMPERHQQESAGARQDITDSQGGRTGGSRRPGQHRKNKTATGSTKRPSWAIRNRKCNPEKPKGGGNHRGGKMSQKG